MAGLTVFDGVELHYGVELARLPQAIAERFLLLGFDAEAEQFLRRALARPHGRLQTWLFELLRRGFSDYDAYGLLGMYPMHLLSTEQFAALLSVQPHGLRRLLDVGAGSGEITARAAPLAEQVSASEASAVMRRRLRARGFALLETDPGRETMLAAERFDAVLCLNVLDRTSHPRSLLANLRAALAPTGVLLLSVPLPLRPHVQRAGRTSDPEEALPAAAASFEAGLVSIVRELLEPAGFALERVSRAPYLCRGDARARIHVLDAALFVCSVA